MITKSKRNRFTACHLTRETKVALREAARQRKVSMSDMISQAVEEKLRAEPPIAEPPIAEPPAPPLVKREVV